MSLDPLKSIQPSIPTPILSGQPDIKSWDIKRVFELLQNAKNKIVIIVFAQNGQNHVVAGLLDEAQFEGNGLKIKFAEVDHDWLWFVGNHVTGHEDTKVVKLPHALWKDIFFKAAKAKFFQGQVTLHREVELGPEDTIFAFHILTDQCIAKVPLKHRIPKSILKHLRPSGQA